jgi:hypothetical protein
MTHRVCRRSCEVAAHILAGMGSAGVRRQQMSRADVAAFMVSIAEDTRYYRASVALSG